MNSEGESESISSTPDTTTPKPSSANVAEQELGAVCSCLSRAGMMRVSSGQSGEKKQSEKNERAGMTPEADGHADGGQRRLIFD